MSDIRQRLDEIQSRADAATQGPWEFDGESVGSGDSWIAHLAANFDHRPFAPADGALIATARTDVPWLIEQARIRDSAIRAVLAIHRPEDRGRVTYCCTGCETEPDIEEGDRNNVLCAEWPCSTVTAITTALGGDLR